MQASNQRLAGELLEQQLDLLLHDVQESSPIEVHMQNVVDGFELLKDNSIDEPDEL